MFENVTTGLTTADDIDLVKEMVKRCIHESQIPRYHPHRCPLQRRACSWSIRKRSSGQKADLTDLRSHQESDSGEVKRLRDVLGQYEKKVGAEGGAGRLAII